MWCKDWHEIKLVQIELKRLGLYDGEIDGFFSKELSDAWADFKAHIGLNEFFTTISKSNFDLLKGCEKLP